MIVIVDTYYPAFLRSLSDLLRSNDRSYSEIREMLMSQRFGTSDAYSANLVKLGWSSEEIVPNCLEAQSAWAREQGVRFWPMMDFLPPTYLSRLRVAGSIWGWLPTLQRVLSKQLDFLDPQVVYFQDLNFASDALLRRLRRRGQLIVGQIASPLPAPKRLRMYDLILSSLPNQVEEISSHGVKSEFLPIAFDERIRTEILDFQDEDIPLSFVGGISTHHRSTIPLLKSVVKKCPELQIYGYGRDSLSGDLELISRHRGERWGIDMYRTLSASRVTLNRHIDVAGDYANNMRLFEATGVGSLLITDKKKNLDSYFKVGEEVLAYDTPAEAADLARWAINNPVDAATIARAGQQRTLTDHTYGNCMAKLTEILRRHM